MNVDLRKTNQLDQQSRNLKHLNSAISRNWSGIATLGVISSVLLMARPLQAAEKIILTYGPLQLSVKVSSLETFAKEGKIEKDLEFYLGKTSQEQQAQFRKALLERADLSPVLLSRFFYTQIGEDILTRLGKIITQERGINGDRGLRAALVLAAFEPEGLTLLNLFKKFPANMQFQGELMLGLAGAVEKVVKATEVFTNEIKQLSLQEAASAPSTDFSKLPDLRQPGTYEVQPKQTWVLKDSSRNRQFYVDVYKPQKLRAGKTPVVLFSHGLASRPEDFAKRAQHLVSYGYVVALPQHPGSDTKQTEALLKGYSREIFDPNEFINRPKDISYAIDELERRNQSEFQGNLDLGAVGVAGHSFGGYTALAVAGAEIDFQNLEKDCKRQFGGLDTSLLLQCRALSLPRQIYNFRDRRVSAVFTENPVNSSIFGPTGLSKIEIPVFIAGGSYDPATPFVFEQVRVFPWLTTSNKYLAMSEGQAHVDFSQLDAGVQATIESVGQFTLPSPDLITSYSNSMSLAFFGTHIEKREDYKSYLNSAYAAYLSQDEKFKLSLISATSSDKLKQAIDSFKRKYNVSPN
jgi:predicted dienelactone hydrolase